MGCGSCGTGTPKATNDSTAVKTDSATISADTTAKVADTTATK